MPLAIAGSKLPASELSSCVDWDAEVEREEAELKKQRAESQAGVCSAEVEKIEVAARDGRRAEAVKPIAAVTCESPASSSVFPKVEATQCAHLPARAAARGEVDPRKQKARQAFLGQMLPTG